MANIDYYGGKVRLSSETLPTGHTIHITSKPSWVTGEETVENAEWVGTVGFNNSPDDREGIISATTTTSSDPAYAGTTSVTCGWTFTQAGTGTTPTPPAQVELIYHAYPSFGSTASADLGVLIFSYGQYQATEEISLLNAIPQKDGSIQIMVATDGNPTVLSMIITVNSLTSAVDGMFSMHVKYGNTETSDIQIYSGYVLNLAPNYVENESLKIYVNFTPSN